MYRLILDQYSVNKQHFIQTFQYWVDSHWSTFFTLGNVFIGRENSKVFWLTENISGARKRKWVLKIWGTILQNMDETENKTANLRNKQTKKLVAKWGFENKSEFPKKELLQSCSKLQFKKWGIKIPIWNCLKMKKKKKKVHFIGQISLSILLLAREQIKFTVTHLFHVFEVI